MTYFRYYIWLLLFIISTAASAQLQPNIKATSAILIDADSGAVLYERNADESRQPASTTKIMTAILLIERCKPDSICKVSEFASKIGESSMNVKPNEELAVRDLLYAILLRSGNDSCVVGAEHLSGSLPAFIDEMNNKAKELGMTKTHFANPHGLTEANHYASARDLAILAKYCMNNETFADIVSTPSVTINRSINDKDTFIENHNKLLKLYPGMVGIKTGFTKAAGQCFVGCANRDGWRLISVVMNSTDWKTDTTTLLDYGFSNYQRIRYMERGAVVGHFPVSRGTVDRVALAAAEDGAIVVKRNQLYNDIEKTTTVNKLNAPITAGQVVGQYEIKAKGKLIRTIPLIATTNIPADSPLWSKPGMIALMVSLTFTFIIYRNRRKRARKTTKNISESRLWFPPEV